MIGGGGVSKMAAAARRRTALLSTIDRAKGQICIVPAFARMAIVTNV